MEDIISIFGLRKWQVDGEEMIRVDEFIEKTYFSIGNKKKVKVSVDENMCHYDSYDCAYIPKDYAGCLILEKKSHPEHYNMHQMLGHDTINQFIVVEIIE